MPQEGQFSYSTLFARHLLTFKELVYIYYGGASIGYKGQTRWEEGRGARQIPHLSD
jgi:hypothetical protein